MQMIEEEEFPYFFFSVLENTREKVWSLDAIWVWTVNAAEIVGRKFIEEWYHVVVAILSVSKRS